MATQADKDSVHDYRWKMYNVILEAYGYAVHWEWKTLTHDYRYALVRRRPEYEMLGIFDDEQTATNMVNMLITQVQVETNDVRANK